MESVNEAIDQICAGFTPLAMEQVPLTEALGRVLAQDVVSRITQPFADVSAMDGYAVRGEDLSKVPATFKVIGESAAGRGFSGAVGPGQAARIFTGAPVPKGADTVVIQENTEAGQGSVKILEAPRKGANVRLAGLDFKKGETYLKAGKILTARDVGLAGAMNVPWLMVRRQPRVAILSTGDELVMPGDPIGPDQIVSSNSLAVRGYVKTMGGIPIDLGIARDDEASLTALVQGARGADLLVTIGGASVGDHDLIRKVLGNEGLELTFYKVAMRPGKPLIFGKLSGVPMLGLPGNPVSAGVTAVIFMRPAIETMLGIDRKAQPRMTALAGSDLAANDMRQDYLRSTLSRDAAGDLVATPFAKQDSSMMTLFAQADCLVVRPPHAPAAKKGERVEILTLGGGLLSI
jgi:molybdopterin molybdotransferase